MKKLLVIGLVTVVLFSLSSRAQALIVKDFENIPETYLYNFGGQNLGTYYSDLEFSPHVIVGDRARGGYNSEKFPPHSGNAVIGAINFDYIRVDFVGFTSSYVEAWYSTEFFIDMYMKGYDIDDNLLVSTFAPGTFATSSLISISAEDIAYVIFHDSDSGNMFTLDDFAYVPEPATMALLAMGGLVCRERK